MWLANRGTKTAEAERVKLGVVTTGGGEISVCTDMERRAPLLAVPYGFAVSVPEGVQAVMLHDMCLGVINRAETLLPGEVRIRSTGGAEIYLKADGTVEINGQVFEKKGEAYGDGDS